jgi:hypothetical protein
MKSLTSKLCGVLVAGAALASTSVALGSPAQSPPPTAGTPSCGGLIVAAFNHNSGSNPNSSGGPGKFLGPQTRDAIAGVREFFC